MSNQDHRNNYYNQIMPPIPNNPNHFYNPYTTGHPSVQPYRENQAYYNQTGLTYRQMYPTGQPYPQTQPIPPTGQQYSSYQPVYSPSQSFQQPMHQAPSPQYLFTEPDVTVPHGGGLNQRYHVHEFKGMTSTNGHHHEYIGTTEPAANNEPNHTHLYWTVTKYDDGHRHELKGRTGPAIPIQGGRHIHMLQGETFGYPDHQHQYKTRTEPSNE